MTQQLKKLHLFDYQYVVTILSDAGIWWWLVEELEDVHKPYLIK
jgi:hypothetical protein